MEFLPSTLALAQSAGVEINTNTVISLATVVVLIGAAWKLSAILTTICEQIRPLQKVPDRLTRVENVVREVKGHVEGLEEDVSTLWTTARRDGLDNIRHRSRPPWTKEPDDKERDQ